MRQMSLARAGGVSTVRVVPPPDYTYCGNRLSLHIAVHEGLPAVRRSSSRAAFPQSLASLEPHVDLRCHVHGRPSPCPSSCLAIESYPEWSNSESLTAPSCLVESCFPTIPCRTAISANCPDTTRYRRSRRRLVTKSRKRSSSPFYGTSRIASRVRPHSAPGVEREPLTHLHLWIGF